MSRKISLLFVLAMAACKSDNKPSAEPVGPQKAVTNPGLSTATQEASTRIVVTRPDSFALTYLPEARRFIAWTPQGVALWWFNLPEGESMQGQPGVAQNSNLYVRTEKFLFAFSPTGEILWRKDFPTLNQQGDLGSPVPLANSGVVLLELNNRLVAFTHEGKEMWKFDLPAGENVLSIPKVTPNGMISVATPGAMIQLRPDGVMQWYRVFALAPPDSGAAQ